MKFPRTPVTPRVRVRRRDAFSLPDLLAVLAVGSVLAMVVIPILSRTRAKSHLNQCLGNVKEIARAVTQYAGEHQGLLPSMTNAPAPGAWWHYRDQVKGYLGLTGPAAPTDQVFGCPDDRGYGDAGEKVQPFRLTAKHLYSSYVFNGVTLPGVPNLAGRALASLKEPARTLLVSEWTAQAPLSWHRSRTGRANTPFYCNAESVVGFADGHAALIPIYFDGCNPAYTRDPVPGYNYRLSAE